MKATIILFGCACSLLATSCGSSFMKATFANKNVYKTKANLNVKKAYVGDHPSADRRSFTIEPNHLGTVTVRKTSVAIEAPVAPQTLAKETTTEVITTIPASQTRTIVSVREIADPEAYGTTASPAVYDVPSETTGANFIRYKVVNEDENFKYIRVLDGCTFSGTTPADTLIVFDRDHLDVAGDPEDFIFQVSKDDLQPNTHYLASTALIGKIVTIPLRIRNEYWDDDNTVLEGTLSLGYGFGYKLKIGNNPYRTQYFSIMLYGAGISQQKYFKITGYDSLTAKTLLSEKTDEIAITYLSFGLSYEYDKFNIGLFTGKDKMFGNLNEWVYQDKWWWGVGVGYELFK